MGKHLKALLCLAWVIQSSCAKEATAHQQQPLVEAEVRPLVQLLLEQRRQQPVPPILSGDIDSLSDDTILAYIRKLRFLSDTEAGDRQGLLLGQYPDSARYGPVATILPEINANRGSPAELRRRGKVIARIQIDRNGAQPYPKLGLLPGATTYWWVRLASKDTSMMGRSVFITVDSLGHIVSRIRSPLYAMSEKNHRFYRNIQPLARFIWNPTDEGTWGTCNGLCCAKK